MHEYERYMRCGTITNHKDVDQNCLPEVTVTFSSETTPRLCSHMPADGLLCFGGKSREAERECCGGGRDVVALGSV